jgi:signal transduction histidine kinase
VIGVIAINFDITEQKRQQGEIVQTSEFRERLIGVVSHDLRSPLLAITLSAQAMLSDESLSEKMLRAASRVRNSAQRMAQLIAQLLDFTRGRQGTGIPIDPAPTDLVPLCLGVVEELEISSADHAIVFESPAECRGEWDLDRIAQVLSNLVGNALKYGAAGTPVTVRLEAGESDVTLSVNNQGAPISRALLPDIFDPFRRGESHPERPDITRGLGLGLFIVQHIVIAHRGTVTVTSTSEEGTTFVVTLPRYPSKAAEHA